MAGTDKLNDLCDTKSMVQHKDVIPIIQALSQSLSFSEIEKLIKSLKESTHDSVFQPIICALAYTMVKLNRTDLMHWVLGKYHFYVKYQLPALLLYAFACRRYKITAILLKAGVSPHQRVFKKTVFTSAPHEDINETMQDFEGAHSLLYYYEVCEIVLLKDDVVLFEQIYTNRTTPYRKTGTMCPFIQGSIHKIEQRSLYDTTSIAQEMHRNWNKNSKILTLLNVCKYKACSILDYCLANQIYHFSHDNPADLRVELNLLFNHSYQHVGLIRRLLQHGILKGDIELQLLTRTARTDTSFPANMLHHVVSLGECAFLSEYHSRELSHSPTGHFPAQIRDIIALLKEHGVRADGLVHSRMRQHNHKVYIRPVTLVATHISLWTFTGNTKNTLEEYIASVVQILDGLPFCPQDMKPSEINPLFFTIHTTFEIVPNLATKLAGRYQQALMIAENICLYFLKQGFNMCSTDCNIYTMMAHALDVMGSRLSHRRRWVKAREDCLRETLGSFLIRMARLMLAYPYSERRYTELYELLCHHRIHLFDRGFPILKSVLHSSSQKEYYQILRGFIDFVTLHEQRTSGELLEFCKYCLANPRALRDLCQATIFLAVKVPVFQHAEELPLPKALIMSIVELS